MQCYKTALGESVFTQSILKSKFIAYLSHADTEEKAMEFINSIRKKHSNATHNCYAYLLRLTNTGRYSDDGEPSGTAGLPIYDVLKGYELMDTAIVVTRYFGGTLLGTGGLVRAYSSSAKGAVEAANIVTMHETQVYEVIIDYKYYDHIVSYVEKNPDLKCSTVAYGEKITIKIHIKNNQVNSIENHFKDITSNNFVINYINTNYLPW